MELQPVKGMRDFAPPDMGRRLWLFARFRETARRFNFQEYEPALLEHEELYVRKEGDEITEQLYGFQDKGGRRVALRPELTPSLVRMIASRRGELAFPLRWFTIGQCFRYEKMQRGRKREHVQWNMDIVGEPGIGAELELLATLADFFRSVGLAEKDVSIRFNNRGILSEVLTRAGLPEERFAEVSVVIDKREKIGDAAVADTLAQKGIASEVTDRILAFMNAASLEECEGALGYTPAAAGEVRELQARAAAYGIEGFLKYSPALVRGLSYYTGTVFEAFDASGQGRAICGGGRYDRLMETFGGPPTPMVGFGFGDVVISLMLEERGLFPSHDNEVAALVAAFSAEESSAATIAARTLREAGVRTELDVSFQKLKKVFARASRQGFSHVVIAGPDEVREGMLAVKDLRAGVEEKVPAGELVRVVISGRG